MPSLNTCLTLLKKKRDSECLFASDSTFCDGPKGKQVFGDEELNKLYGAIKQLSEIDRVVILLYLGEKPYKEIAEIIGAFCSENLPM